MKPRQLLHLYRGTATHRGVVLVGGLFLVVALAACGSSSSGASSPSHSTAAPSRLAANSTSGIVQSASQALYKDYVGTETRPPKTGPKGVPGKKVWIISCGQAVPGCSVQTDAAAQAARVLGWKVTVFDGNFDANNAEVTGIQEATAAGADGIILVATDCNTVRQAVVEANAHHIKVMAQDGFGCSGTRLMTSVVYSAKTPSLATYGRAQGKAQADWLITKTHGSARVLDFVFVGNPLALQINAGFLAEIHKCKSCSVTYQDVPESDFSNPSQFEQTASGAILKSPSANAIEVPYDSFVTEAVGPAIVHAGRTKSVLVIGNEGFAANLNLIRTNAGQNADPAEDQGWVGWATIDTMNRLFAGGQPVPEGEGLITIDSAHNMPPADQNYQTSVNYRADYKVVWGK